MSKTEAVPAHQIQVITLMIIAAALFTPRLVVAAVCGQLAAVKGPAVELLRMQAGRGDDRVRHAIRMQEGKVASVECDDVVLTGKDSSAKVILATAKLTLAPDSRVELAQHTGAKGPGGANKVSLLNLTYGKMRALVKKKEDEGQAPANAADPSAKGKGDQAGAATFRVKTFSAVVGVRGTDFFTSYEPNSGVTDQATIEGAVEVRQAGTSQKALVTAGQQVSVETTAAAVKAAEAKDDSLEPPKDIVPAAGPVKPLVVVPIKESVRNEIRVASAVAKDDIEFAHAKAVETLGKPETWTMEREPVPEKLRDIKNEF